MTLKNYFILFLVLTAVASNVWLIRHMSNRHIDKPKLKLNVPDGYMVDATYTRMNKQGQVESWFYTPKIIHYPKRNSAKFTAPHIIVHSNPQVSWDVTAQRGTSTQGTKIIKLLGNVVIHRISKPKSQAITIKTSELTIYPSKEIFKTTQPVTIIQGNSEMHSIGLHANLKTGKVLLLHRVRVRYIPQKTDNKIIAGIRG